jgi:hypothetical protein
MVPNRFLRGFFAANAMVAAGTEADSVVRDEPATLPAVLVAKTPPISRATSFSISSVLFR